MKSSFFVISLVALSAVIFTDAQKKSNIIVLGTPDISMDQQGQEQGNGQENQSFLTVTPLKGQEQENGQENQSFPTVTPLKGKEQKNENDNQFISVETNKGKEQNINLVVSPLTTGHAVGPRCFWVGTSPFCFATCGKDFRTVTRDERGNGKRCLTGLKKYCCPKEPNY